MDIFQKAYDFTTAKDLQKAGIYPYFIPMEGNEGSEAVYKGQRIVMCGSNNYLGLTMHPKVREATKKAVDEFGTSCTGSRLLNGTLELHLELERQLAEWVGKESALVFTTGMQTNLGTVSAIVGRGEYVVMDKSDHASLYDGARLSYGEMKRFRHNDMEDLDRVLSALPEDAGKLVVVDGLYSMEGSVAPLPEIVAVCKKYGARLMVDDAHGTGVLGGGRGTPAHFGVTDDVDLIMSTFSKSFASVGGFIAGDDDVIDYIKHNARSFIFSASIPAANCAAVLAALEVMRTEPERIERVNLNARKMHAGLTAMGYKTGESITPIVPVILGNDVLTFTTWQVLLQNRVYVNPVVSPAVPDGQQLLRCSFMSEHTEEQLDYVLEVFEKVGKQLNLI
jgi:8-amino-7-oxononanoate synthase